ncbi:MAG: hypothetical protein QNJ46_21360 [Leptolyngbyaceae cyanobacterium MO_188.B28]|nr:hypothetical protein [Leptolyngbyaceae cyanobacterium MO_188.B28]
MKCLQCGIDNQLRDRTANQGRCKSCGHLFAFEPTAAKHPMPGFTDVFFAKLIQDLSVNGALFFTEKQLQYLLKRRLEQQVLRSVNILNMIFGFLMLFIAINIAIGIFTGNLTALIITPVTMLPFFAWLCPQRHKIRQLKLGISQIDRVTFLLWIQKWREINGIPKLLPPLRQETSSIVVSPEVSDYSFERVVVCENDSVAQLLIANNLHFEHNCAVISLSGYPLGLFETVIEMLQRNPNLSVYALHGATPTGVRLSTTLRLPKWFPNPNVKIYDLGLSPRQAMAMKKAAVKRSNASARQAKHIPETVRQTLSRAELNWLLAGNFLELESFGPKKLLRVVSQRISWTGSGGDTDAPWAYQDTASISPIILAGGFG